MKRSARVSPIALIIVLVLLIAGVSVLFIRRPKEAPTPTPTPTPSTPAPTPQPTPSPSPSPPETPEVPSELKEVYKGFMSLKKGDWVEWKIYVDENVTIMRYVYAGEDVIDGEPCVGIELYGEVSGDVVAVQWWISKERNLPVKAFIETEGGVFVIKYEYIMIGVKGPKPEHETPELYRPENIVHYEIGTFTTETGKTVRVVKVLTLVAGYEKPKEDWVSSEVPFGLVKIVDPTGKVQMELRDFGSGAKLQITKEEREKAKPIPGVYP